MRDCKYLLRHMLPGISRGGRLRIRSMVLCAILAAFAASASEESESVFKLAQRFFSDSLFNLALEQYQKYLGLNGRGVENDPAAYYNIGLCQFGMENMRKAADSFEEYVKLFPSEQNVMDAMYYAGLARRAAGDYKEASDWFYSVWSRFVGSARARSALFQAAECAARDNNPERAIELYETYLSKFSKQENAKEALLALVALHIAQQQYSQATEVLDGVPKAWGADKTLAVRVLFFQALINDKMQKIDEAGKYYAAMDAHEIRKFPERRQAYERYVEFLVGRKKLVEALGAYETLMGIIKAEGAKPDRALVWAWAETARGAKKYDVAERAYRMALSEYGEELSVNLVNYRIAECLMGMDEFPRAIEMLQSVESAGKQDEHAARAALKIGDLYFGKELFPSAIAAYQRYLQYPERNDKDRVLYRIAKIYQDKYERYGAALREYENLLKWYPASSYYSRSVLGIAQCYEQTGEHSAAIRQYEFLIESGADKELVEEAQKRVQYLRTFRIKNAEEAAYKLAELLRKSPQDVSALERLLVTADVYENDLKDLTKALETYERIETLEAPVDDSVKADVLLGKARIYRKLHMKAEYEDEPETAAHAKNKALVLYDRVMKNFPTSDAADDAAFNVIQLTMPNVSKYEEFIDTYPHSPFLPEVLFAIALHYERRSTETGEQFSQKAADAYQRIVREFPSSGHASRALIGLARSYLILGQLDSVSNAIAALFDRYHGSPLEPEAYFMKGMVAKRRGQHTEAADIFKQVLYRYPFSPFAGRARFELAFAQLEGGEVFEALNNFRLVEQGEPGGAQALEARYGVGKCLLRIGKQAEATEIFDALLSEQLPEHIVADLHYERARIAQEKGNTYAALNHYKGALAIKEFSRRREVFELLGRLYFETRIYEDAANAYEEALRLAETGKDSVELTTRAITALIMDGKVKKADKMVKKFTEHFGERPASMSEIVYYEGVHYLVEKEYDKAIKRFEYVLAKYEDTDRQDDAAYQIPLSYFYAGKNEEALKLFYEFPARYPNSEFVPLAYFKLAMIHHGRNEFAQAAEYFTKVSEHSKTDPKTRFRAAYNAAVAYQKISAWLDAARMHTLVLKEFPGEIPESSLHLKIGFCLIQASRVEEALEHFQQANVNPSAEDKPEILYWIATCYAKLGEYQRAISEYLKVPYLYSGVGKWGVTAEFESARLYERQGEYAKAVTLYKKILRSDGEQGRFGRQAKERIQRLSAIIAEKP